MTTNAILPAHILSAVSLLHVKQAALDAITWKIKQWASRIDDEVKMEFYKALDFFLLGINNAVQDNRIDMLQVLIEHVNSFRPCTTKQELNNFMREVDQFEKHIHAAIKKEEPQHQEEYERISTPFQLIATAFLLSIKPCKMFRDQHLFGQAKDEWNRLAAQWKKALDENLPLRSADL